MNSVAVFVGVLALFVFAPALAIIFYVLRHNPNSWRSMLRNSFTLIMLGMALLVGQLVPAGFLGVGTQVLFLTAAVVLAAAELRADIAEWRNRRQVRREANRDCPSP